jgi:hypothetical protein
MKKRLFDLSMVLIVTLLASVPFYLLTLLDSKPGTTWMVTVRFLSYTTAFILLLTLLHSFLAAIPMKPEIRKAASTALMGTFIIFSWRVFPPAEPRHEALVRIFRLWAVALIVGFATSVCWEFWRSSRKKRNLQPLS